MVADESLGGARRSKRGSLPRGQRARRELHEQLPSDGGSAEFVCECADDTCVARITVPLTTYERVRDDPRLFLVAKNHVRPEIEHVVEEDDGFVIVRKDNPTSARITAQTDPRV
jgi:hypothetical protein